MTLELAMEYLKVALLLAAYPMGMCLMFCAVEWLSLGYVYMKKVGCIMEDNRNIAVGETCICRYCGLMVNVQWLRGFENHKDRDADYLASRFCGCLDSKKYAEAEQRREDAAAMRKITLENAREIIDALFGPPAKESGLAVMNENVRDYVYEAAALVYDGDADRITVDDSDGITAKIKLTSKGQLRITRSQNFNVSQET